MKPQDLLVLLKKLTPKGSQLSYRGIAESLGMSVSSVSESLERSKHVQLLDQKKKRVNVLALEEFLLHGLAYVFPAELGRVGRGIPTYVSASPIKDSLGLVGDSYVWHTTDGTSRGQQIVPLYPTVPQAAQNDSDLYELLVIVDTLRLGRAREKEIAADELAKRLGSYAENQQ